MMHSHLLLNLFGILACFVVGTVSRKAIVGGVTAGVNEFPYQVAIKIADRFGCGGGILNDDSIITAASCVVGPNSQPGGNPIVVLAGTNDLNKNNRLPVSRDVKRIYIPIEYTPQMTSTTGNIAVLKLAQPLNLLYHYHLKRVILPRDKYQSYANHLVRIAGFGWNHVNVINSTQYGGRSDTLLRYAEAMVLNQTRCQEQHPALRISPRHLCAQIRQYNHSPPRGVCNGDGGGPLTYDRTVIGIFTIGPKGCSEKNSSGVYTRVSYYLHFVDNVVRGKKTKYMHAFDL